MCTKWSLYEIVDVDTSALHSIVTQRGIIDAHCPYCDADTVFHKEEIDCGWDKFIRSPNLIFVFNFLCSRNLKNHLVYFVFKLETGAQKIQKIGQFPSVADLAEPSVRKYRPVLGKQFPELTRAIGLAAHGVGVGSFVYLRRIFERLIEEAHQAASKNSPWDEAAYQKSRMDEKIEMLSSHLPEFLVQERSVYRILSVGIHSLSEQDCLNSFDVVRVGIELMLDEKLQKLERDKKAKSASESLKKLREVPPQH